MILPGSHLLQVICPEVTETDALDIWTKPTDPSAAKSRRRALSRLPKKDPSQYLDDMREDTCSHPRLSLTLVVPRANQTAHVFAG